MPEVSLNDILLATAEQAVENQRQNGSFPPGNNGPHQDPETPVRNTSHYLILLTRLYAATNNETFKEAAIRGAEYLLSNEARPYNSTFHHRNSQKDKCNGIIGQAWTIEAIAEAGRVIQIPELIRCAEDVFLLHPYDERLHLWKRVEINGEVLCFDSTLNHQIWFAAAGALLAEYHDVDDEIKERVLDFLDGAEEITKVTEQGLISGLKVPFHMYPYAAIRDKRARLIMVKLALWMPVFKYAFVREPILRHTNISRLPRARTKRIRQKIGYHSFHLYGFSLLKSVFPNHAFFESDIIEAALELTRDSEFRQKLSQSSMGYAYNISGVELAYSLEMLGESKKSEQRAWVQRQFDACWERNAMMMSRNTFDPETLTSRLYEAARLSSYDFQIQV